MTLRNNRVDIHNYDQKYKYMKRYIQTVEMSERNRELILAFDRRCFLKEALSKPRLIRIMQALSIIARRYAFGDFDQLDKKAVEEMVLRIETNDDYSIWTKQSYKSIIKKFYKWLVQGDACGQRHHYPDIVSWINTNVKKKDKPKVKASDLLTEQEIKRLMSVADHPRDKAFISMIYELGARIGEIGGLRIQDVTKDQYSYIVDLSGKTGHRTPRIVIADPDITAWLNVHPMAEKPDAPLWLQLGDTDGKFMEYGAFRQIIQRLKKRAGVKKRLYHHLFRHTRVTHLLMNKDINEAQAKVYFGWVPESKMLSEYAHLMSSDVNNAILRIHGIKTNNTDKPMITPKQCPRCQTINSVNARFCSKCSAILDLGTAIGLDEENRRGNEVLADLMTDPEVRHFLARKIHEMGLKDKRLKGDS